jgi:hypothetical protein
MDRSLPPPPGQRYEDLVDPMPSASSRPGRPRAVTTAAVLLLVTAAFSTLGGLAMIGYRGRAEGMFGTTSPRMLAVILIVLGVLDLLAGSLVLGQRRSGRVFALVLAGAGIIGALAQLGRGPSSGLVSLAIYGFILYALLVNGSAFDR